MLAISLQQSWVVLSIAWLLNIILKSVVKCSLIICFIKNEVKRELFPNMEDDASRKAWLMYMHAKESECSLYLVILILDVCCNSNGLVYVISMNFICMNYEICIMSFGLCLWTFQIYVFTIRYVMDILKEKMRGKHVLYWNITPYAISALAKYYYKYIHKELCMTSLQIGEIWMN